MLNRKLLLVSLVITGFIVSLIYASFGPPLMGKEKIIYIEELKSKDASNLEKMLETVKDDMFYTKTILIIEELGNRKDNQSKIILETYAAKLKKDLYLSPNNPLISKPYATVQINLAKIKAGGHDSNEYIEKLGELLANENKYFQDTVALELSNTMKPEARDVLLKFEDKANTSTGVSFYRLRMDLWNLDDNEFLDSILYSARERISKGDKALVAERSLLSERTSQFPLSLSELEKEIKIPSMDNQAYKEFLNESLKKIQSTENAYYQEFPNLWERYKKRESSALTDLEKIYRDDSYTKYNIVERQAAYEMYLRIQMEQPNLNNSKQDSAIYLLSQLTGTGDGHLSDYDEKGRKTTQAIKNTVLVRLLSRYSNEILPVIDEERRKESQSLRKDVLTQIEKQIEITKR